MTRRRRSGAEERAALEVRRDQALRDLADVERQRDDGELDAATAAELTVRFEAELADAAGSLAALDHDGSGVADSAAGRTLGAARVPSASASTRRRWVAIAGVALVVAVLIGLLVQRDTSPRPEGGSVTGDQPGDAPGRDLESVTTDELEDVVAANPGIVGMRIALVERYLADGNIERAHEHSIVALGKQASATDHEHALRYAGWTTALLGSPQEGAELLEESLAIDPRDLNAQWYLANVRLTGLDDPDGAITLLEGLLNQQIDDERRTVVQERLDQARQRQLEKAAGR